MRAPDDATPRSTFHIYPSGANHRPVLNGRHSPIRVGSVSSHMTLP